MVDINKPKQFSVGKKNKLVKCFSKTKVYPSFKESKIEKEHKLIKKKVYFNKPLRFEPWQKAGICHPW